MQVNDSLLGRDITCLDCGEPVTVQAAEGGPPPFPTPLPESPSVDGGASAESPDVRSPSVDRGWVTVDAGLAVSFWSLVVGMLGVAVIGTWYLVFFERPRAVFPIPLAPEKGGLTELMLVWCLLATAVTVVALLTGWVLCAAAKGEISGQHFVWSALAAAAVAPALLFAVHLIGIVTEPSAAEMRSFHGAGYAEQRNEVTTSFAASKDEKYEHEDRMEWLWKWAWWLALFAWLGSWALFGLFLGTVGRYFGDLRLRRLSWCYAVCQGVFSLWCFLYLLVPFIGVYLPDRLEIGIVFVFILIMYAFLAALVQRTRAAISEGDLPPATRNIFRFCRGLAAR